jgi:protein-tyrosine phosphatase
MIEGSFYNARRGATVATSDAGGGNMRTDMPMRPVSIDDCCPGELWLGSMPGRFERWAEFAGEARRRKLSLVVCLAAPEEVASLSPLYWQAIGEGALDFRWLNLPMQNFGLPQDLPGFRAGIEQTATSLAAGDTVLLHCAAGIGRTGAAAACLLKRLGLSTDEAMERVRDAGSNPETALQSGLVNQF